jgi:mRNA interferase MazF
MKVKKWEIYRANLEPVIGSEQGKSRPVIIISEDYINDILNVVNVLTITTRKPGRNVYPNEAVLDAGQFGLPNESIVLCYQIRTLDKKRISGLYGKVNDSKKQNELLSALCFQLGINTDI